MNSTMESSILKDDKHQQQLEIEKNKYLFKEKCFVCKKLNPNPHNLSSPSSSSSSSTSSSSDCSDSENNANNKHEIKNTYINNTFKKLTKLPLWMCNDCKIKCKEEEDNKLIYEKV